jgi:hypothetical protein
VDAQGHRVSKLLDMLLVPVLCVAAIALAGWYATRLWDTHVGEPYREAGRAELRPQLEESNRQLLTAHDIIKRQSAAVYRYEEATKKRLAAAALALRESQGVVATLQAKAKEVAALPQPTGDPCVSACTLLARPL